MKHKILIIVCALTFGSCNPIIKNDQKVSSNKNVDRAQKKSEHESQYLLVFNKIDNKVHVYINDSLIFDSGMVNNSPELNLALDLGQHIESGDELIRIELFNGHEPYNNQIDPLWEVRYDLFIGGEIADFIHESGDNNAIGKVFEANFRLNDLK